MDQADLLTARDPGPGQLPRRDLCELDAAMRPLVDPDRTRTARRFTRRCCAGSLLLLAVPGLIVLAVILGVVAVVLGAVAVGRGRRSGTRDGTVARAIAGMVLGGACLVILAGLVVAALVGGDDDVVRPVAATAADLQVGDCVVTVRDGSLATVPCDVEHHAEVYAVGVARDAATYPGLATLDRQATEHCDGRLGAYVGSEARARRLAGSTLWPDEPTWAGGSRASSASRCVPMPPR